MPQSDTTDHSAEEEKWEVKKEEISVATRVQNLLAATGYIRREQCSDS